MLALLLTDATSVSESCDDLRVEETRKREKIVLSERGLQLDERKQIAEEEVGSAMSTLPVPLLC